MNYKPVLLNKNDFDDDFIDFINSFQGSYQREVLEEQVCSITLKRKESISEKINKVDLIDFFFTPRYNVVELFKMKKNLKLTN